MKKSILTFVAIAAISITAFGQKMKTTKSHIKFFSHTVAEDIEANNYKAVGTLNPSTGDIVFSVPMQSFEFEKALMQKHFNSKKFLDTKQYPKAKLKGKITNLSEVNFKKDGEYKVTVKGELTLHGITKPITEKATIIVKNGKISGKSKFNITLADYKIAFEKGKPSTNIAKTVEVTIDVQY